MKCSFDEINDKVNKYAASMQQISQLKQVYLGLEQQTQTMFDEAKSNKDKLTELLNTLGRMDLSVYSDNLCKEEDPTFKTLTSDQLNAVKAFISDNYAPKYNSFISKFNEHLQKEVTERKAKMEELNVEVYNAQYLNDLGKKIMEQANISADMQKSLIYEASVLLRSNCYTDSYFTELI